MLDSVQGGRYNSCLCCTKHIPLPISLIPVSIAKVEYYLCPTAYYNLRSLIAEYDNYGHEPPGSVRKHYSEFVQTLARLAQYDL